MDSRPHNPGGVEICPPSRLSKISNKLQQTQTSSFFLCPPRHPGATKSTQDKVWVVLDTSTASALGTDPQCQISDTRPPRLTDSLPQPSPILSPRILRFSIPRSEALSLTYFPTERKSWLLLRITRRHRCWRTTTCLTRPWPARSTPSAPWTLIGTGMRRIHLTGRCRSSGSLSFCCPCPPLPCMYLGSQWLPLTPVC